MIVGGRGRYSATVKNNVSWVENDEIENLKLRDAYGGATPTEYEEESIIGGYSANLENEVAVSGRNSFTLRRVVTRENQRFGKPTTYYYFD